ncbi:MAG: AAA family ATPase [Pirellulaceae bacterium]|nr:AAA family ATPase [Pirellulaceae bacterium]
MYESFFGLTQRPFAATPSANRFFSGGIHGQSCQALERTIRSGDGPALLLGAMGTGKTMVCHVLADQLAGLALPVYLSAASFQTRKGLLGHIHSSIGLPYKNKEVEELRLSLVEYLTADSGAGSGLFLIVDDAHRLSLPVLDELGTLSGFIHNGLPKVRLLLSGKVALEERLTHPKLESLSQKIQLRAYVEPFNQEDTFRYIDTLLGLCSTGESRLCFQEEAKELVYQATDGVPRIINQVCDHALMLSALANTYEITPEGINESWQDLQQFSLVASNNAPSLAPTPQNRGASPIEGVVEFGSLDDEELGSDLSQERFTEETLASASQQLDHIEGQIQAVTDSSEEPLADDFEESEEHSLEEEPPNQNVTDQEEYKTKEIEITESDQGGITSSSYLEIENSEEKIELIFHKPHSSHSEGFKSDELIEGGEAPFLKEGMEEDGLDTELEARLLKKLFDEEPKVEHFIDDLESFDLAMEKGIDDFSPQESEVTQEQFSQELQETEPEEVSLDNALPGDLESFVKEGSPTENPTEKQLIKLSSLYDEPKAADQEESFDDLKEEFGWWNGDKEVADDEVTAPVDLITELNKLQKSQESEERPDLMPERASSDSSKNLSLQQESLEPESKPKVQPRRASETNKKKQFRRLFSRLQEK